MIDWDRRLLALAEFFAGWSKDPSTQVGAVIVRPDGRTVATHGYNGFPRRCDDDPALYADRERKYPRIVHAEANAIVMAREPLDGCALYTWPLLPCPACAGLAIQAGIARVVSVEFDAERWREPLAVSRQLFDEAGVRVDLLVKFPAKEP